MKKFLISLLASVIFAVGIILNITPQIKETSNQENISSVYISVLDIYDLTPINNATIIITETGEHHQTNDLGSSGKITLPYHKENKIKTSFKDKPWNEYTIIITKNGYIPHIHFGLKIESGRTKTGTTIKLTPLELGDETKFTTSYEYPSNTYITSLIEKHNKKSTT